MSYIDVFSNFAKCLLNVPIYRNPKGGPYLSKTPRLPLNMPLTTT